MHGAPNLVIGGGPMPPVPPLDSVACGAYIHCVSTHQVAMSVVGLLRAAMIIAGLAESNGISPPGL